MHPLHGSAELRRGTDPNAPLLRSSKESSMIFENSMPSNKMIKVQLQQQLQGDLSTKHYTPGGSAQSLETLELQANPKDKLFTREFYNLKRSSKRRDIESVSLHKHPKSHLHGIFDKWRVQNSLEELGVKAQQPTTMSPRQMFAYQYAKDKMNVHRSVDHQDIIPLRHLTKYGLGAKDNARGISLGEQFQDPNMQIVLSNSTTPLPHIHNAETLAIGADPVSIYQNTASSVNLDDREVLQSELPQHGAQTIHSSQTRQSNQPQKGNTSNRSYKMLAQNYPPLHPLNEKKLRQIVDSGSDRNGRLMGDFQLYRQAERQVYGSSQDAEAEKIRLMTKVNRQFNREIRHLNSAQSQEDSQERYQSQTMAQPLTHSEVNVNAFVKNSPVFMGDEERRKSLQKAKPLIGKSQLLARAIGGRKSSKSTASSPSKVKQQSLSKKQILNGNIQTDHSASIIYQDQSESLLNTAFTSLNNLSLNIESIKDLKGFQKKSEAKLNDLLNPDTQGTFDTEQSRYLYKIITDKVKEMEAKEQEHLKFTLRKNHQYESSPTKKKLLKTLQDSTQNNKHSMKTRKTIKFKRTSNQGTPRSRLSTPRSLKSPSKVLAAEKNAEIVDQLTRADGVVDSEVFNTSNLESNSASRHFTVTNKSNKNSLVQRSQSPYRETSPRNDFSSAIESAGLPPVPSKISSASPSKLQSQLRISGEKVKNRSLIRKNRGMLESNQTPVNEAELVKNYFQMKGKVGPEELQDRFETDIFNQLHMAEKIGVYSALQNMKYDADSQLLRDRLYGIQTEFPGYEEHVEKIGEDLQQARTKLFIKDYYESEEVIGEERRSFSFAEGFTDLTKILKELNHETLKARIMEVIREVIKEDHVKGVMAQIEQNKQKDAKRTNFTEEKLTNYIKYLVGEQQNDEFKLRREDFQQKHELNQKSLKLPFDEYAIQEENSMKTVANDIIERVDYNTVVQHYSDPASIVKQATNPKFAYFHICTKDCDLAIPLLAKVVNKQLSLLNYQLSVGHVKAFCKTFDFNKEFISKFLFDNCGLTDAHNEILFKSMTKLEKVSDLVLKRNEFCHRSVEAIQSLLEKPKPYNLSTLRIINCKIQPQHTRNLIQLIRKTNNLKTLGLVNCKISDEAMQELGMVLQESNRMQELDISWNVLKLQSYVNLINGLGSNKTLVSLNLSWNTIFEETETIAKDEDEEGAGEERKESHRLKRNVEWYDQEVTFTEFSTQAIENLCNLLKKNKRLQHVNLTKTGLTEYMIIKIGKAMRRAKALCSIHFDGNKGVTQRVKDRMHELIRCMPLVNQKVLKPSDIVNQLREETENEVLRRQLTTNYEKEGEKPVARETIKLKQIFNRKRVHSLINDFGEDPDQETVRLTCTRILGHKTEMLGSGQWKMITDKQDECWICDQQVYSLIFWDEEYIASRAYLRSDDRYQHHIVKMILDELYKMTPKEVEDAVVAANPDKPIIYGDFTNWEPKPFAEVCHLAEQFQPQFTDEQIFHKMKENYVMGYNQNTYEDLKPRQREYYKEYVVDFFEKDIDLNWKEVFERHLPYKKPHLVYGANTRPDYYKKLFVFFSMLKVGKHEFIVRSPGIEDPKYYYYSSVSDIRAEQIHHFVKTSKHTEVRRVFDKENSVFAPWKEDTRATLSQAVEADILHWKMGNVIKDQQDYKDVVHLLKENMNFLKDVYLDTQSNSAYPFISMIELSELCKKAKMVDERLNVANLDLLYVSTYEKKKLGQIKNKSGLLRFEFFEYLFRVAKVKYIDTRICKTYKQAFETLLAKHLKLHYEPQPWQAFRDQQLWDFPVNDVLKENMEIIKRLHKFYDTPQQQYMSAKDAISLMTKDSNLALTSKQAKYCIGFCKMTVTDEVNDFNLYNKIYLVEFLEMIGRMAHIKYSGTALEDEPIAHRIEYILDDLFVLIGARRRDVPILEEEESDSDDDY